MHRQRTPPTGLLFGTLRLNGKRINWQPKRLSEVTFELSGRNGDLALGREAVMGVTNSRGIVPMREQTVAEDISRYKRLPPPSLTILCVLTSAQSL
jgi:type I restriction enzyme S subunit